MIYQKTKMMFDTTLLVKYLLQGLAVAVVSFMILKGKATGEELLTIGLVAAASYAVMDSLAPTMGVGARLGTGLTLGSQLASI